MTPNEFVASRLTFDFCWLEIISDSVYKADFSAEPTVEAWHRETLECWLAGVPEVVAKLKTMKSLAPEDYRLLERLDVLTNGYVARILNDNSFCCATVCPGCMSDDFCHLERCKTGYKDQ